MKRLALLFFVLGFHAACGGAMLDGPLVDRDAQIRETNDTRAIYELMSEYRQSMEAMDLDRIHALVSRDYYENGGTTDTTEDDYGFAGVTSMLRTLREHVEDFRVEVAIRDIVVEDDRADVFFEFSLIMLYRVGDNSRWQTERDINRIQLQRHEDGRWLILSGL